MNLTPEQLERRLELELELLRPLKTPRPDAALLSRLRSRVVAEARSLRAGSPSARLARWSLGVAAALALALALARSPGPARPVHDPFDSFDVWARAMEDSAWTIENGFSGYDDLRDPAAALDEWLQGLGSAVGPGS